MIKANEWIFDGLFINFECSHEKHNHNSEKKIIFLLLNGFCVFKPDSGGKSARVRDHDAVCFRLDLCVFYVFVVCSL